MWRLRIAINLARPVCHWKRCASSRAGAVSQPASLPKFTERKDGIPGASIHRHGKIELYSREDAGKCVYPPLPEYEDARLVGPLSNRSWLNDIR